MSNKKWLTGGETHVNLVFKIEVAGTTPLWEPTGDDHREQQSRRTLQAGMSRRGGVMENIHDTVCKVFINHSPCRSAVGKFDCLYAVLERSLCVQK